jgi:NADPH:quinone reductase-like Zn-dependent oxidoreductase
MSMRAGVVRSFDQSPRYEIFDTPEPVEPNQVLVKVLAAGLHPRVRSGASGSHYTSTGALPLIPGIDGVGQLPDGKRVYFVVPDDAWGSMAEQAVVDLRRTVPVPDQVDAAQVAAGLNPAMSSWVALRRRAPIQPGQSVLILGATGNAGSMAVQVAKLLGAGRVVGAGRRPTRLAELTSLGADAVVALSEDPIAGAEQLTRQAAEVDIVLDYLWGDPASSAMMAILKGRADRSRLLDWIQIGSIAGATTSLPSVALRSANLRIQGNGQGAVSTQTYLAELPSLIDEIGAGTLRVTANSVPLKEIATAWTAPEVPGTRTVFIP